MKLPRAVTGKRLIDHLCRYWDYKQIGQKGSHVILKTDSPVPHRIPVPLHSPLGIGILKTIPSEVCEAKNIAQDDLLRDL